MGGTRKPAKKSDPSRILAVGRPGEDEATAVARTVLHPTVQAAATLKEYGEVSGTLHLEALVEALSAQTKAATEGDLTRAEAMLTAQTHTLDAIFNNLARRAINAEYMVDLDRYLKLALRAQSQCRATWEALATIKNPPIVGYVRQANIAHGHQQVNNDRAAQGDGPRARENENLQSKLLEETDGERLDTGAAGAAGGADPAVVPVGEVERAENTGR